MPTSPQMAATSRRFVPRRGMRLGFRSGLEDTTQADLSERLGAKVEFEPKWGKITYTVPEKKHTYTPDFILPNGIIIETKGWFKPADRQKHLDIRRSNPQKDIRFVFQNPNSKINKRSKTTYAMWCDKQGFKWAKKVVPQEWIDE